MHVTVTITDKTKGPFNIYTLLTAASGSLPPGVTRKPAVPPMTGALSGLKTCTLLNVQNSNSSPANTLVYSGDAETANDGTCQAADLPVGAGYFRSTPGYNGIPLLNLYVNTNTNNAIVNIEAISA